MADALTDGTKYTIFAPTNDAFESRSGKSAEELMKPENREELIAVLRAHIVADDVDKDMAGTISEATTIDGGTVSLTMSNDELQIGDANVTGSSIQQGSLRVYLIDSVLEPQSGASTAASGSSTRTSDQQTASSGSTQPGSADTRFDELDQDGNGFLNQQELQDARDLADSNSAVSRLDSNQDGQVSRTEFSAFEQARVRSSSQPGRADAEATGTRDSESRSDQQ